MKKSKELRFIQQILPDLFTIAREGFESSETRKRLKRDEGGKTKSPVTETDIKIDRYITKAIKKKFPEDSILSEEAESAKDTSEVIQSKVTPPMMNNRKLGFPRWRDEAKDSSDLPAGKAEMKRVKTRLWVVDPICGTGNFASGIKFFLTNISLFEDGKPVFAAVVDYSKETYYWAEEGRKGICQEDERIMSTFSLDQEKNIIVDQAFIQGSSHKNIKACSKIAGAIIQSGYYLVNYGSSLSFTYAALAKYGAFIVFQVYPWDFAASCYLIEKNGGVATDFSNQPWSLSSKNIVASSDKQIHKKLLKIIKVFWRFS